MSFLKREWQFFEVVLLDLEVLSDVCQEKHNVPSEKLLQQSVDLSSETKRQLSGISPYFVKFATSLLQMFRKDRALLNERGSLIIRSVTLKLGILEKSIIFSCTVYMDDLSI